MAMPRALFCVALVIVSALSVTSAQEAPDAASVLRSAGAFIADYQQLASALVAEERYSQRATAERGRYTQVRRLRSDVLVVPNPATDWVFFRDVFEVDNVAVEDRQQRLEQLFLKPDSDTLRQAARIAAAGTRYDANITGREIRRTFNNPMSALRFLMTKNQPRSRFRRGGTSTINGTRAIEINFDEQAKPRILATPDGGAAFGRFWIEPTSGAVLQTEMRLETNDNRSTTYTTIRAQFGREAKSGLWVPLTMDEEYRVGYGIALTIQAHADYSSFRRFAVDVNTVFKQDENR